MVLPPALMAEPTLSILPATPAGHPPPTASAKSFQLNHANAFNKAHSGNIYHTELQQLCPVVTEPLGPPQSLHASESGWD